MSEDLLHLAHLVNRGDISKDEWVAGVQDVLAPFGYGLSSSPGNPSAGAAPAVPSPADPEEAVAPKLSARLLQSHGADSDLMQRHVA
jgi:hypothetical protein